MARLWLASAARHDFKNVVDAAVDGEPQFIRRRDGREVVLVSREYFETTRSNLKSYLLTKGNATEADDAFDRVLQDVRATGGPFIEPVLQILTPNIGASRLLGRMYETPALRHFSHIHRSFPLAGQFDPLEQVWHVRPAAA